MADFTELGITRQEALFLWLRRKGITQRELSEKIGLSTHCLSIYFKRGEMPSKHFNSLVNLGIPTEYLPLPVDKKRGVHARRVLG